MMDYYLQHHGILGQKWGIRRYQNEDGSLTPEGKKRIGDQLKIQRNSVIAATTATAGSIIVGSILAKNYGIDPKDVINGKKAVQTFMLVYGGNVIANEVQYKRTGNVANL